MRAKTPLVVTMTVLMCAASAHADSVDGKPTHASARQIPASVRGSPSILFEGVGALGPLGSCGNDGDTLMESCGAQGRF